MKVPNKLLRCFEHKTPHSTTQLTKTQKRRLRRKYSTASSSSMDSDMDSDATSADMDTVAKLKRDTISLKQLIAATEQASTNKSQTITKLEQDYLQLTKEYAELKLSKKALVVDNQQQDLTIKDLEATIMNVEIQLDIKSQQISELQSELHQVKSKLSIAEQTQLPIYLRVVKENIFDKVARYVLFGELHTNLVGADAHQLWSSHRLSWNAIRQKASECHLKQHRLNVVENIVCSRLHIDPSYIEESMDRLKEAGNVAAHCIPNELLNTLPALLSKLPNGSKAYQLLEDVAALLHEEEHLLVDDTIIAQWYGSSANFL